MATDVKTSGPVFDGRAEAALHRGIDAARHRVASEGEKLAAAAFLGSIRVDRGDFLHRFTQTDQSRTYESQSGKRSYTLVVTTDAASETIVTNDLATYGPWLEGTGSRNSSTRFKGYHGMRRATQALDAVAGDLADETIKPYVGEMNG